MATLFQYRLAARLLRAGAIIAYPTEGVWGLGCDPDNAAAIARLLALKQRDPRKGLILVAADMAQLARWLDHLSPLQWQRLAASWPGPETWVVPHAGAAEPLLTGGKPGIALRVSAHPAVVGLCRAFGGPIVSTSANPSGRPAPRHPLQVRGYFGDRLDFLLPGAVGGRRGPSTIRDLASGELLRE